MAAVFQGTGHAPNKRERICGGGMCEMQGLMGEIMFGLNVDENIPGNKIIHSKFGMLLFFIHYYSSF